MEEIVSMKWGPDVGDIFDPGSVMKNAGDVEPMLILPEFQSWDLGLILNEREGHTFWQPFELLQFHGIVRGVEVWIEAAKGRMGRGKTMYRIAFGKRPEYPEQVDVWEASRLLKEHIPPMEYVHVSREEWDTRRNQ